MTAAIHIEPVVALVDAVKPTRQNKRLRSYPELVNYILEKFEKDLAIVHVDSELLRYKQPTNTTTIQYADDL